MLCVCRTVKITLQIMSKKHFKLFLGVKVLKIASVVLKLMNFNYTISSRPLEWENIIKISAHRQLLVSKEFSTLMCICIYIHGLTYFNLHVFLDFVYIVFKNAIWASIVCRIFNPHNLFWFHEGRRYVDLLMRGLCVWSLK